MSKINDGGPAFAHGNREQGGHSGMSLRDWLAGQVLQGYLAGRNIDERNTLPPHVARDCYRYADAMLAERTKGGDA